MKNSFPLFLLLIFLLSNCDSQNKTLTASQEDVSDNSNSTTEVPQKNPNKNLYWGDTHLHTNYSTDAFIFGTMTSTPDAAYRFAKGEVMTPPATGQKVQLKEPLDFLVVSDHAEGLGNLLQAKKGDANFLATKRGKKMAKLLQSNDVLAAFSAWQKAKIKSQNNLAQVDTGKVIRSIWKEYTSYADKNYEPGKFTTFIGWEWTSKSNGKTLHRVVFTSAGQAKAKTFLPYSSAYSNAPEDLWNWLDNTSKKFDVDFIAIPHNSNISGGLMFPDEKSYKGNPVDKAYAQLRSKWESVAEITQIKGTSETHPSLSPTDEFADFEIWNFLIDASGDNVKRITAGKKDLLRSALKTGLKLEEKTGVNPYKYGLIGSSDAHTAMSAVAEDNFQGKFYLDGTQPDKSKALIRSVKAMDFSASGYAAVWAQSNTREDIFAAFKRKEVYATTGPRIQLRFFAGYDFSKADIQSADYVGIGYQKGVPMGGDLTHAPTGKTLQLMIHTAKAANGANLDRVQVVKGWLENGATKEKIFEAKWAGDRQLDAKGKLPPVGNSVDTNTATYTNDIGTNELAVVWQDPEFNPNQKSFYYIRVLEIPTPRFSTYASAKLGQTPWEGKHSVIQERAYSSPIWYTP